MFRAQQRGPVRHTRVVFDHSVKQQQTAIQHPTSTSGVLVLELVCVFSGRLVARRSKADLAFGKGFCGAKLCRTDLRQRGQLLVRLGCLQFCILRTVCSGAMATTLLQICATLAPPKCACRRYRFVTFQALTLAFFQKRTQPNMTL